MPTPCKKGEIWRVGYIRTVGKKGSKRNSKKTSKKNSKHASKKVAVKGKCIKATSQTGEKTSIISREYLEERKQLHKLAREKFGTPECAKGEIVKEGYRRKSKSGKQVWVQPTCVTSKGKGVKQERLFYVEPGRLSKYGYDELEGKSDLSRHKALKKAFQSGEKPLSVSRRLNALATLTKNTNPKLSHTFKEDSKWIKFTDEYANRK